MPIDAEMETVAVSSTNGTRSSRTRRSAMTRDLRRSATSSVRIANSSPPRRASTSPSRISDSIRRVTATSSASPVSKPWLSLTVLKSSRSMNSTDEVRAPRRPLVHSARCRLRLERPPVGRARQRVPLLRVLDPAQEDRVAQVEGRHRGHALDDREQAALGARTAGRCDAPARSRPSDGRRRASARRSRGGRRAAAGRASERSRGRAAAARAARPITHARSTTGSMRRLWLISTATPWLPSTTRPSSPIPSTRPREKP